MKKNIKRIVLTGGPCSGKSTALDIVAQQLKKIGYKVFICEEMASALFKSGIETTEKGLPWIEFQEQLILQQLHQENFIYTMAQEHNYENTVILLDRGIIDNMAYVDQENFIKILNKYNQNIESIRDNRYDAVFHLVSAAIGAESFYTLSNNLARTEGIEKAKILDNKIKNVWKEHAYMRIIDNSTSFEEKISRLVNEIFIYLGITHSQENK